MGPWPTKFTETDWHIHASVTDANNGLVNGLLQIRPQIIILTDTCILLIGQIWMNFIKKMIKMQQFSFRK